MCVCWIGAFICVWIFIVSTKRSQKTILDSPFIRKEYSDAKVEAKEDKYLITAEGDISLEFTKFMNHIIVDSEGMEYIRKDK